jgi:thioredoxin-like negative regulator of GroEL
MQIRLTRIGTILLMILLLPFVATLRLVRFIRRREKPIYRNTIEGDPLAYTGDNPILIALWADWAHIWDVATRGIVAQLEHEFAGRCEFAYIEAINRTVKNTDGARVVPTLILRHHGADIERFVNVLKPDDVRSAIAGAVANRGAASDRDRSVPSASSPSAT